MKGIVSLSITTGKVLNFVERPVGCKYKGCLQRPRAAKAAPSWAVPIVVCKGRKSASVKPKARKNSFDITLPKRLPESTRALQAVLLIVTER